MFRDAIEQAVRKALADIGAGGAHFVVERPAHMEHGDYATNATLVAKVDPHALASKLKIDGVEKVEVVGKFINFWLSREALVKTVENFAVGKLSVIPSHEGKIAMVEYTSPNLFKPLHIGNLVGNVLGESIARLLEQSGATVKRINYPSDIGLTVAKGVWGLWKHKFDPTDIAQLGKAYVAGNVAYEDGSAKAEIEGINRALYENSNPEWSDLRKKGVETSRRHLDELCEKLGTTFDKEFFESESGPLGRDIVRTHIGKVFEESEGAVVFRGEHTRVFITSEGFPTYEAKEIGLFELKNRTYPDFDISITVTGSEQKDYFKVV
ncbi:MAG: arginine--tRNA ligase, partial [Bacteroidetes bacterium RIFCSPHIGHO2_02_FULL_44_7]